MSVSFLKRMKIAIVALLFSIIIPVISYSQVATNGGSGLAGTYTSLNLAITALNAATISSPVIITLNANETAPAGGYTITAQGTAINTIVINGNGYTITAGNQAVNSRNDAIFKLRGADYITLQNFTLVENPANTATAVNNNTMTEWGIALLYATQTNGAKNNTIQNNTISLNRAFSNSCGIYSSVKHSWSGNPNTAADITNVSGSNSDNKVYGNTISNVACPIIFAGSGTANYMDDGNDIGGSTSATGNNISNWGNNTAHNISTGLSNTIFGIYCISQKGLKINYNSLISASLSTNTTTRGIYVDFTANPNGTFQHEITNNTITLINGNSSSYEVIRTAGITGLATATININNNSILNCTSVAEFNGIYNTSSCGVLNMNQNSIIGCSTSSGNQAVIGIRNNGNVSSQININDNELGNSLGNCFTYSAANTGLFTGISNIAGAGSTSLSISGNNFQGIVNNSNGSGGNTFIINTNATGSQNISDNSFTNLNISNSGSLTFISNSVTVTGGGTQTVSNNSIVGTFSKVAGGTVTLFTSTANSAGTAIINHTGNNFSNITLTGGTNMAGWVNQDGTAGAPKNISNNTFSNWSCGNFAVTVLNLNKGINTVSGNTISNISGGFSITCIQLGNTAGSTANIVSGNTIGGISSTGASLVVGITSASSANILKNKIYNLSGSNASSTVNGIAVTAGTTHNISNNLIGDLTTPNANAANPLIGINLTSVTTFSTINVFYNTIYLNASSSAGLFGCSGLFHTTNTPGTTATLNLRNNIIVNKSTPKGAGVVAAYRRSNTTLTNYGASSNNNLFYGGSPAANRLIFYDGTNADQTLAAFQARVTPRESNSQTEDPNFSSTTGTDAGFLHIVTCTAQPSLAESGAVNIASFTDDYDNEIRQGNAGYTGTGTAPDIGADEFEITTATISYTGSPYCISSTTPVNVTLTGTGSYTGGTFSSTPGLSINSGTGAILPSASTAGTYTITYTKTVGACTVTASTQVTINALPPAPTITPSTPCEGSTPTFTAGNGSIFEFTFNGISQGAPSTNTTFTPASALTATDQVCVRSYSPFIFDGNLTESAWGSPLATSAGGPNPSGFGAGNNLDALYIQSTQSYLFGGIAGSINSTNRVLLFIDCQPGGYNDLSTWINRNGTPCHAMENLNYGTTFDAGFAPDYILGINTAVGDTYFDLYNMQTNTFALLGTSNTSDLFGFIANSGYGDYFSGFEFAISRTVLGNPSGIIKVFVMITNEPPTSGSPTTFLSNQFLTRANSGESNYGDFPITFGSATPDPISVSLSGTECYSETCATILSLPSQPGAITGNSTPCIGANLVYTVPIVSGITYTWTFPSGWAIVSGQNTNSVTVIVGATSGNIQVTPSNACGTGPSQSLAVNPMDVPAQPSAITGSTSPCVGSSQNYSVTNVSGVTYTWNFPAGWTQTAGGTTNAVTITVGANSGNIQVTPSNTCGNGTPRNLAVNPSPIPVLTNNGPYTTCSGTGPGINLNASTSTPSTFSWTIGTITGGITGATPSSGNTINQVLTNPSNSTNGSVNYVVTPTSISGLCVGSPTTIQVIVEPAPTVNPISNATYCSGVVVPASSFGSSVAGSTYTWTSSTDIGFGTSGSGNIPAYTTVNLSGSPVTATISVIAKSPSNCFGPARNFTVTINPTTVPTITADYCSSPGNILLTANPGGLTYQWYESGVPISGATTQTISVDHASVYSVVATNSYGCQGTGNLTVANELVVDGSFTNFNAASPAFVTGYTQNQAYYNGTPGSGLYPEGYYAVNTSAWSNYPGAPQGYHNNFHGRDHTNNSSGARNFMMINGSINTSQVIWQQSVSIQPNTAYYFSAWGMNLNPGSPARLQFEIETSQNGLEQVGSIADLNIAPKPTSESQVDLSNWVRFYSTPFWTSPAGATTAIIRIINLNTDPGGNDFGLDDISFGTLSSAPATVTPTANGGGAVCEGGNLNLNANLVGGIAPFTFSWTGPNGFTSNLQNPVITNVSSIHAGTYNLTVTDGYGCSPQVQTVDVVVSASPVDPVSASVNRTDFCADDAGNITLTAAGGNGTTLHWYSGSCGGTSVGTGTPLVLASPVVSTTYFARWEGVCGNSACVSTSVNVFTLPTAPLSITASSTTVCEGTSLTLTANGGNGGTGSSPVLNWYTGSCGGTLIGTGTTLNLTAPASNTTYYARWESSCGNSTCASIDITVNPLPQAPTTALSDRNNFCEDDPGIITLSVIGGSGSTLNWYTGSCGGTLIGSGASFSLPSPTIATTYYASWQNGCGSSACASVTVTVLTKPTAPTSASAAPNPVCAGSSVELTAIGGDGGTGSSPVLNWYSGSCGGTLIGSGSPLTITAPGINTTYYARWESGCGSSSCASVIVNIDPLPATPTWNTFSINVCAPTNGVVFSVNPVPGALSYVWSYSAGNAVINAPSNTNSITMDFSAVGAMTIGNLSVYAVNACGNGTPTTRIVRAYPEALVNAGPDETICAGQNVALNGTASVGSTTPSVTWTSSGDGTFLPNTNTLTASYTPGSADITNGTVTLTLTTPKPSAPCPGPVSDQMVITILPAPSPVITGSNSACVGTTGAVYSTVAGMTNYNWAVSAGGTITAGGGITDNTVTVSWNTTGPQTVSVNYTAGNGCSAIAPTVFNVLVNPLPNASISYSGGPFCPVGSVNVTRTGQGGGTYSAAPAGLSINAATGQINLTTSAAGTYTVTYSFTNGTCPNTTTATVIVKEIPDLFTVTGGGSYCAGGAGVPVGLSGSQLGVSYQLQIGGINTGMPVAGTGAAISFGNQTAAGPYTVIATLLSTSCSATMTGNSTVTIVPLPATSLINHF